MEERGGVCSSVIVWCFLLGFFFSPLLDRIYFVFSVMDREGDEGKTEGGTEERGEAGMMREERRGRENG